jgi:hypothetical protein
MKLPVGTPIINLDSANAAQELADAIGAKPGDTIEIMSPQFSRTDGFAVPAPLVDPHFWRTLHQWSVEDLKNIGLQVWDKDEKGTLLLFPAEWYDHIPNGYTVTSINGKEELFRKGVTDDDRRFGALAYGILKEHP